MKTIKNLLQFLIETVFWIITFLLTWCMHIQNNDITPAISQNDIWHTITNKLYSFNYSQAAFHIPVCQILNPQHVAYLSECWKINYNKQLLWFPLLIWDLHEPRTHSMHLLLLIVPLIKQLISIIFCGPLVHSELHEASCICLSTCSMLQIQTIDSTDTIQFS